MRDWTVRDASVPGEYGDLKDCVIFPFIYLSVHDSNATQTFMSRRYIHIRKKNPPNEYIFLLSGRTTKKRQRRE